MDLVFPQTNRVPVPVPVEKVLLEVSQFLRNFGASIIGYDETNALIQGRQWDEESETKYRQEIVKLLVKYCNNGNLNELKFHEGNLAEEDEDRLVPLMRNLREFGLSSCQCSAELMYALPSLCPELRILDISCIMTRLDGLRQSFQKLIHASFIMVRMSNATIRCFLNLNRQLKKFRLRDCTGPDVRVYKYIGKYTTNIEILEIAVYESMQSFEYPLNAGYFYELKNLKSITLYDYNGEYIVRVIYDIAAAGIRLKTLCVGGNSNDSEEMTLEVNVAQLKTLQELRWRLDGPFNRVINICANLTELSMLDLRIGDDVNAESLFEILQIGAKLQWLTLLCSLSTNLVIDTETYNSMVQVIDRRVGKIDLKIFKSSGNESKIDVPEVVLAAHKTSLTIVLENAMTEGELMYTEI